MDSWLIPCSPYIYDTESAFNEYGSIVWHQQCNMLPGDIAYMYITSPVKEIRCKCRIEEANIPFNIGTDDGYRIDDDFCSKTFRRYMILKLLETYDCPPLGYHFLLMNGLSGPIRSQRRAGRQLAEYIERIAASRIRSGNNK